MMYSTKTVSNTPPGCYRVCKTLSYRKSARKQTEDRRQKANHTFPWTPLKWPLMQLHVAIMDLILNEVVDCAVGFLCLHLHWTTPPQGAHSDQLHVNQSGSNMQFCQTLRLTFPVVLSTSRCSQTPRELSNVLWHSASAFSGAPDSTWRYGGEFWMLRDLTNRKVKFGIFRDLCAQLQESSWAAVTAVQLCGRLRDQLRPLHNTTGDLVPYFPRSCFDKTTRHFVLSYSSLLQPQSSLHHTIACSIQIPLCIYLQSIWPQIGVEQICRD
jgi:hypothetical protein